jgi:hypothetical protein
MVAWGGIILNIVVCSLFSYGVYSVLDWMNVSTDLAVGLTCFAGVMTFLLLFGWFGFGEGRGGFQTEFGGHD